MINRIQEIKSKGFTMIPRDTEATLNRGPMTDYSKIKVGIKTLEDAVISLGQFKKASNKCAEKDYVLDAISKGDFAKMREISTFFYNNSGIYKRVCRYFAYLYKYDWLITPYINNSLGLSKKSADSNNEKVLDSFFKALKCFDDFQVKKFLGTAALEVIKNGCYYGYIIAQNGSVSVQQLAPTYCRSRYSVGGRPAVEFNMKYFDDAYPSDVQRAKVLSLFPQDFQKGYKAYKTGKLLPDFQGDTAGWYLLDIKNTIKFNLGDDFPMFIAAIPTLIDLDAAKGLDQKKVAQKLLKILVQKMPMDKNGDLIFDVDEAKEIHNNAVRMLSRAIGIDVLTTFADVDVEDMADNSNSSQTDDLERVERGVYNEFGTSQMNFNSTSNTALNNSILNDEANILNLIQQFESFLNMLLELYNKNSKKFYFKAQILPTTIYNYKELAKLYKEQTQMGYSKMLPQIALGQSQSSILANVYFENNVLNLAEMLVPPMTSNTMNAQVLQDRQSKKSGSSAEGAGRPEKDDSEKSEKTLANRQSL